MKELDKPDVRQYYYVKDHQDVLVDAGIVRTDRCVAVPDTYTFYHTSDKNAYNQEMTNILVMLQWLLMKFLLVYGQKNW